MLLVEKNCTLLPQTVLEFLAVLHEKIKTNIHLISINAFKNLFYILPLSVKIVMNLCLLSSKHETACQILTTTRSQVTQVVFFFHLSIIFRHVSLINTEPLNSKQFWICVKLGQVLPLKVDETVHLSYFKQAAQLQFIWFTQQLDYKAFYKALTELKISSKSWLLTSWHICRTNLIWNEKSVIFISNRSNLDSHHEGIKINAFS